MRVFLLPLRMRKLARVMASLAKRCLFAQTLELGQNLSEMEVKVHFSFRAERHAVNDYRLVMLSVSFSFLAHRGIFSAKSRKKVRKRCSHLKVSSHAIILEVFDRNDS